MPKLFTIDEQIERGKRLEQILNEPVVIDALEGIEETAVERWKSSKTPEDRESAHALLQAAAAFKTEVNRIVQNGKMAERQAKTTGKPKNS